MAHKPSQIVFFLGAGASVKAGVPDTFSFVDEFVCAITDEREKSTVLRIIKTLEDWRKSKIDIELLLETLTKLQNKQSEPLLLFYEDKKFILEGELEKQPIIRRLKDFIKSKAIVSEEKVDYLKPMLGFVEEYRPLDIISLNYDTCVEQLARVSRLTCQDGFDSEWKPEVFDLEGNDIRLYKIHGSILWYETDSANYIKVPVMSEASEIKLFSGEKAQNLMLYPMQKMGYSEPLLELLVRTKKILESKECEFLVVVGYSFRDDHIVKIVLDSARKNRNLHIVLIGPNAYDVYFKRLKYYAHSGAVSSALDGRVCCLPYKFEAVLPELKDRYIKKLREAIVKEKELLHQERRGNPVEWGELLSMYSEVEYFEKIELLLSKMQSAELLKEWETSLWIYLTVHINLFAGNDARHVEYLMKMRRILADLLVSNLEVFVEEEPYVGDLVHFKTRSNSAQNNRGYVQYSDFRKAIVDIAKWFKQYEAYGNNSLASRVGTLYEAFKKIHEHTTLYGNGMVNLDDYVKQNGAYMTSEAKALKTSFEQGKRRDLAPLILQIERIKAEKILNSIT